MSSDRWQKEGEKERGMEKGEERSRAGRRDTVLKILISWTAKTETDRLSSPFAAPRLFLTFDDQKSSSCFLPCNPFVLHSDNALLICVHSYCKILPSRNVPSERAHTEHYTLDDEMRKSKESRVCSECGSIR